MHLLRNQRSEHLVDRAKRALEPRVAELTNETLGACFGVNAVERVVSQCVVGLTTSHDMVSHYQNGMRERNHRFLGPTPRSNAASAVCFMCAAAWAAWTSRARRQVVPLRVRPLRC